MIESRAPGSELVLGYDGVPEGEVYVLQFLEQRRAPGTPAVRGPGTDVDLLLVGCSGATAPAVTAPASILLPFRVHLVLPVPADVAAIPRQVSRKARQQFARQRVALDWQLRETADPADFEQFYERFHVPTMRSRHGAAARTVDRETADLELFRNGTLFLMTQRGDPVAGMLCRWARDEGVLTLRLAGIRDADRVHYASGVFLGLYLLILEWAVRRGLTALDLSGCEPFLSKGIFQFKRKLHPRVAWPPDHFAGKRLVLRAMRDTPDVRDFLVANPVIALEGPAMRAVYFHDDQRPARLDYRYEGTGLAGHRLEHLDDFLAATAPCG